MLRRRLGIRSRFCRQIRGSFDWNFIRHGRVPETQKQSALEEAEYYDGKKRVAVFPVEVIKSLLLNSNGYSHRVIHGDIAQIVIQDAPQAFRVLDRDTVGHIVICMETFALRPSTGGVDRPVRCKRLIVEVK